MLKLDKHHLVIVAKTLLLQAILFCGILFILWGSQKLYALIDPVTFPDSIAVPTPEEVAVMSENEKGQLLIDALTHRMRYELDSTFGWSANDLVFNKWVLDNRAYRQFGTYVATRMLMDNFSTVIAKLGSNDREDDNLYKARVNEFAISPQRWGILFLPSAESSYKNGLKLIDKYKAELAEGKAVYNCRPDDVYNAFNLILGDTIFGYALGQLSNAQDLPFYTLDNRIYEAQGVMLVVRDYVKMLYALYPEVAGKNNANNMAEALKYLDLICNYDPLYITSWFNSGELIISYMLFARNRLEDIRDSIRI